LIIRGTTEDDVYVPPPHCCPGWASVKTVPDAFVQNAELGCVANFEHDDAIYLEKSEQMHYNVEDRDRVEGRYKVPPREQLMKPPKHHPASRYRSSMVSRKLGDDDNADDDYDRRN